MVTLIVAGVTAAAVVVAEEMANAKQTVETEAKTQQSTIKKQRNGSKDNDRSGVAAANGGRQCGNGCGGGQGKVRGGRGGGAVWRQGGGGDRSDSHRGVQWSSSNVIDNHHSTGESWSNTSPNNDGGGGGGGGSGDNGGGKHNHHTPSFSYRRRTAILPDCTGSRSGVLDGRGGTCHYHGDCNDVAGYCRHHISQDHDRDYDDDDNDAGHTTLSGQRDRGSAPLLPPLPLLTPLLPLLSIGGTVPLIYAHP